MVYHEPRIREVVVETGKEIVGEVTHTRDDQDVTLECVEVSYSPLKHYLHIYALNTKHYVARSPERYHPMHDRDYSILYVVTHLALQALEP